MILLAHVRSAFAQSNGTWGLRSNGTKNIGEDIGLNVLLKDTALFREKKLEVLLGYICSAKLFNSHAGEGFL